MRIGIEAQRLFRKRKHGIEFVAIELIKNLQILDKRNQYFIFVKPDDDNTCVSETENFKIIEIKAPTYPIWEQLALPHIVRKMKCDVLHCTSNTAPIYPKLPVIVTLHDIIYLEKSFLNIIRSKGTNYQRFGNIYRRIIVPGIVKSAKRIITVSEFEKKRIIDFFGLSSEANKVVSIYNGVSKHFKKIENTSELEQVKKRYGLPDDFILFLGNTDPKKNTANVLKAYAAFLMSYPGKIDLVILDYDTEQLAQQLDEIGLGELTENIHLTGYVVNNDLPAIYSLSKLFLYPSLRESFGIPLLEAMCCGTPVITSNTSSMPEVAGDAAFFVNPEESSEITEAIVKLNRNNELRNELIQKGYTRSAEFSWEKMARNVLKIYESIKN